MTNTTQTYLSIADNLKRYQTLEANKGQVKTATQYYEANIGKVTSAAQLVGNYRLLSYALNAYGLGDQIDNTALIKQVLEQGTTSSKALANTLPNPAWKAFAQAFNFAAAGAASPTSSGSVQTTVNDYTETQLEEDQGESDPGVQLALYFQRVAPTIKNSYGILGNQNLLEVVQTIFGLASTTSAAQIDHEAAAVQKLVPLSELQNPGKLKSLIERFTAAYDAKYGDGDDSLAVNDGNATTTPSAAASILSQVVGSNGEFLASGSQTSEFGASLLDAVAGL